MLRLLLALATLCLYACGGGSSVTNQPQPIAIQAPASTTAPASAQKDGPVVFMGDSLFANWKPGPPAYAATALTNYVLGSVDLGIVGNTTEQMLARFPQVLALHPSVVVILAGANDLRLQQDPVVDNVAEMAEQASAAGASVIICTVPPGNWWEVSTILSQDDYLNAVQLWNAQLRKLAEAYGYGFVDFYTPMLDGCGDGPNTDLFYGPDYIEPGAQGYELMWGILKGALGSQP